MNIFLPATIPADGLAQTGDKFDPVYMMRDHLYVFLYFSKNACFFINISLTIRHSNLRLFVSTLLQSITFMMYEKYGYTNNHDITEMCSESWIIINACMISPVYFKTNSWV